MLILEIVQNIENHKEEKQNHNPNNPTTNSIVCFSENLYILLFELSH